MKRLIAALLAGLTLFALVGCSAGSKADSAAPKDYSQILHDARTDEENEYDMIFTKGEDGKFTAIDGYSAEYEAGQLDDEVRNLMMPLLNLEDQYQIAKAATVTVAPTGEVILVCAENHDTLLANIEKALAA